MARGKQNTRKQPKQSKQPEETLEKSADGSTDARVKRLLEMAEEAMCVVQLENAIVCYKEALKLEPNNTNIMDALADVLLQVGEIEGALNLLKESTTLAPLENGIKWMFLAQLLQGHEALSSYKMGIQLISGSDCTSSSNQSKYAKELVSAYCSIAELYMTDLCFEDGAEEHCESFVLSALALDPDSIEALQTLSSLRISQCRTQEALSILEQIYGRVKKVIEIYEERNIIEELKSNDEGSSENVSLPSPESLIALAKLLLECSQYQSSFAEAAYDLLQHVLLVEDDNPEVWYLIGVSLRHRESNDNDESADDAFQQAIAILEKGLAANPTNNYAQNLLAVVTEGLRMGPLKCTERVTEGAVIAGADTAASSINSVIGILGEQIVSQHEMQQTWSSDDES